MFVITALDENCDRFQPLIRLNNQIIQDALAMYFCMMDPATPLPVKATIAGALTYFLSPIDAIPDAIVGLGFTTSAPLKPCC
jgi:uncharacterized membrane protein YkvA (DUF1232 family)